MTYMTRSSFDKKPWFSWWLSRRLLWYLTGPRVWGCHCPNVTLSGDPSNGLQVSSDTITCSMWSYHVAEKNILDVDLKKRADPIQIQDLNLINTVPADGARPSAGTVLTEKKIDIFSSKFFWLSLMPYSWTENIIQNDWQDLVIYYGTQRVKFKLATYSQ